MRSRLIRPLLFAALLLLCAQGRALAGDRATGPARPKATMRARLGAKAQAITRPAVRAGRLLAAQLTVLADHVAARLPAAEAASFQRLRATNPLAAAGFVGKKIKADWHPLWMWIPGSLAISNGMHYWLVAHAGLDIGTATLIRIPAGVAVDLSVIGAYSHHRRKRAKPGQTLRDTGRELKAEYLQYAARRRARHRRLLRANNKHPQLGPRLGRFLRDHFPPPGGDK